ncbi:hypothetical protein HanRHA438_Chr08g0360111 [Helianthus annuus]|uniref:Uncharacterized protein n=2 Tax=Helianthus annuus TaxID=4232 RepID=A0A9K3ND77_HELAN|nr:hypothetical protein HanXRQr2_Chr08g0347831 [Helianthus annuus]KAJ0554240.1 hypothetical protein HanHA89_Chr08g0305451 [Helianthus annuus]KAJ0765460.1 hypothetical protein HanPI659440_Chr08g0303661 [Helianthus annuus]KAJ0898728.1 hypothetical protein HanRHA438_Chr08g0360111 [Helianthus annuus]KAJ0902361.1 hypothetical protein HanPSC8_Chr08g0336101 [Helianthus annuus]
MDLNRIMLTHFTTFGSNIMFVSFYLQTLIHSFHRSLHSLSLSQIPPSLKFFPLISMETCYFQDLPTISTFLLFNLSSARTCNGGCPGSKVLMVSASLLGGFGWELLKTLALSGFSDIHICQNWVKMLMTC